MNVRRRTVLALLAAALAAGPPLASAAPMPSAARAEVLAVLDRLAASGCRFERNGRWHDGAEARRHLLDKLAHAERRAALTTAEQFVDAAGTRSSVTGRPYAVRCADAAPVPGGTWLREQLAAVRRDAPR